MKEKQPAADRHRILADAQQLLMARRAALRQARKGSNISPTFADPGRSPHPEPDKSNRTTSLAELAAAVDSLPPHLGWGSKAQTAVLRAAARRRRSTPSPADEKPAWSTPTAPCPPRANAPDERSESNFSADGRISLAPSLGLAILRHNQAAAARLWLLLRALDQQGRGAISREHAHSAFTDKTSALHICGRRHLRNLLNAGSGLFWEVDDRMIWLRSAVHVARSLGVAHFRGQDVALPVKALTGGIGAVRANLFASFHSGRTAKPIARKTLARKCGVAPRTQRRYDRLSGVSKQRNFARGPQLGSEEAEEQAVYQGAASFTWRERRRGNDDHNRRFLAWQLPNSYQGPHARLGRGRQKRHNKALADLLNIGTAGNDLGQHDDLAKRYFADARAAVRAVDKPAHAVYWPDIKSGVWHYLLTHEKRAVQAADRTKEAGGA